MSLLKTSCTYKQVPIQRFNSLLRSRLPLNVLLLDGKCTMSVGHMIYTIERNYSFSATDEEKNEDMLLKNRLFYASFGMVDAKELTKNVVLLLAPPAPQQQPGKASSVSVANPSAATELPSFLVFVEQVPSKSALAKSKRHGGAEEKMFMRSDGKSQLSRLNEEGSDLLITTGGYAMIRMLTHLDRGYLRVLGHILWRVCPSFLVRLWTKRQLSLRYYHGMQCDDVFKSANQIRGLQERLWTSYGVGSGKVKKPVDLSRIFSV
eukprot:GILI01034063.1.p1 GENE.GILI01034063.1~~GILI01034063.1.p1  ORF type:complete len:263 (+),score=40.61 GILI01034063.1:49-837(+)